MSKSSRSPLITRHALGACVLSLLLTACGTASDVTAGARPNTWQVTGKATGTEMSWVTARNKALDAANDFCKQRSQRASVKTEATKGVRPMEEQTATVSFTCIPLATNGTAG